MTYIYIKAIIFKMVHWPPKTYPWFNVFRSENIKYFFNFFFYVYNILVKYNFTFVNVHLIVSNGFRGEATTRAFALHPLLLFYLFSNNYNLILIIPFIFILDIKLNFSVIIYEYSIYHTLRTLVYNSKRNHWEYLNIRIYIIS